VHHDHKQKTFGEPGRGKMNDFQYFPLKRNPYKCQQEIVRLLLELKDETDVPYSPELYEPRRQSFQQQITTTKAGISGKTPARL
jgi:hypothetical protein